METMALAEHALSAAMLAEASGFAKTAESLIEIAVAVCLSDPNNRSSQDELQDRIQQVVKGSVLEINQ